MLYLGMADAVGKMNEAFGNPRGDPLRINGPRLLSQCKNIGSEFKELMLEFGLDVKIEYEDKPRKEPAVSDEGIRDALCDIMVFALGAYHLMGYDVEADMREVVESLFSRFCKDPDQLMATRRHFDDLGVQYIVEGSFPQMCLKSAFDQGDGEYPKGKFLKAVGYRKPFLRPADSGMTSLDLISAMHRDSAGS